MNAQEALTAYQRRVIRRYVMYRLNNDDDDDADVDDWVGLLSTRVEGRVRRRCLLADVNVTDWRSSTTSTGHGQFSYICIYSIYSISYI